jgi:hypothetical protein
MVEVFVFHVNQFVDKTQNCNVLYKLQGNGMLAINCRPVINILIFM